MGSNVCFERSFESCAPTDPLTMAEPTLASSSPPTETGTKTRLLDAAERLFADFGFEGTSMRAVTQAAGTAVSAANYHFGSKQELLRAVLQRRIEPINRERIARLAALLRPLSVEAVIDAFVRPTFEARAASKEVSAGFRQVAARLFSDPPEVVSSLRRDLLEPVILRFVEALGTTLPDRDPAALRVGFHFVVGTLVHVIGGHLDGARDELALDDEAVLAQLVAHCAAGLRSGGAIS